MKIQILKNIILSTIFIISLSSPVKIIGQGFNDKPISNIIIVGNDKTDSDIIERELLFSIGEIVSDSVLQESKKRIENLIANPKLLNQDYKNCCGTIVIISGILEFYQKKNKIPDP